MKPIVLVHGAWHGAWCWESVQTGLRDRGIESIAVHLPFTGLADDAATLAGELDLLTRAGSPPAVLMGHSYGGMVISEATAGRTDVDHLVYLCALMLRAGQTTAEGGEGLDTALAGNIEVAEDLLSTIAPGAATAAFYGDADPDAAAAAEARLRPFPITSLGTVTGEPWREVSSTYVVCTQDRAIHPDHQRYMARSAAHVVEWPTDHSPFMTRPELVTDLLIELATT
ncbi:MAG: alpha/beta fold hydrolase [Acidimicrobiales bacterium]